MVSNRESGFGLFEALIALLVVSMGMLGVWALHLSSLQQTSSGIHRSKALVYAQDMATRMRINSAAFPLVNATGTSFPYDGHDSSAPSYCDTAYTGRRCDETSTAAAQSCTIGQLAAFDLQAISCGFDTQSKDAVDGDLPKGAISVRCNDSPCTTTSLWVVTVSWDDNSTMVFRTGGSKQQRVRLELWP